MIDDATQGQDINGIQIEPESDDLDTPLDIPPERRRLITEPKDLSIRELHIQYTEGDLILDPEFQRFYVYNDQQASSLIESILLDVPIPVIYLSQETDNKNSVIDGQQRLTSFMRFLNNEFPLRGLRVFPGLNGSRFQSLEHDVQAKIKKSTIRCIIIQRDSDPNIKFDIFERLNSGAVQLNAQELRNCVYRGNYNHLVKELAEDREWLQLAGAKFPDRRMKDREMILRFFAFYHSFSQYNPPIKRFLNDDAKSHQNIDEKEAEKLKKLFKKSVRLTLTVFGEQYAFKRFTPGDKNDHNARWESRSINMGFFDCVMHGFTHYEMRDITPKADMVRDALFDLISSSRDFNDAITIGTSEKAKVNARFMLWMSTLRKTVGASISEPRLFSYEFKQELFNQNSTCSVCGQRIMTVYDASVDHTQPYSLGGATEPANGRLTHRYCNLARGNRS